MSEKFRLDRKIGFQNTFYTKCINVIIDSIGPSIILRSIIQKRTFRSVFPKFSSGKMTLCNNNDQTGFSDSLTSARPLWASLGSLKPSPFRLMFHHPWGPADVNA